MASGAEGGEREELLREVVALQADTGLLMRDAGGDLQVLKVVSSQLSLVNGLLRQVQGKGGAADAAGARAAAATAADGVGGDAAAVGGDSGAAGGAAGGGGGGSGTPAEGDAAMGGEDEGAVEHGEGSDDEGEGGEGSARKSGLYAVLAESGARGAAGATLRSRGRGRGTGQDAAKAAKVVKDPPPRVSRKAGGKGAQPAPEKKEGGARAPPRTFQETAPVPKPPVRQEASFSAPPPQPAQKVDGGPAKGQQGGGGGPQGTRTETQKAWVQVGKVKDAPRLSLRAEDWAAPIVEHEDLAVSGTGVCLASTAAAKKLASARKGEDVTLVTTGRVSDESRRMSVIVREGDAAPTARQMWVTALGTPAPVVVPQGIRVVARPESAVLAVEFPRRHCGDWEEFMRYGDGEIRALAVSWAARAGVTVPRGNVWDVKKFGNDLISVMVRVSPADAERMMPSSGVDGVFLRQPSFKDGKDVYPILGLSRDAPIAQAGAVAYAKLGAAFRGLVHFRRGMGVRVTFGCEEKAREVLGDLLLPPDDDKAPRYRVSNAHPSDDDLTVVGCLAKGGWDGVRVKGAYPKGGGKVFVVAADEPPPFSFLQVGDRVLSVAATGDGPARQAPPMYKMGKPRARAAPKGTYAQAVSGVDSAKPAAGSQGATTGQLKGLIQQLLREALADMVRDTVAQAPVMAAGTPARMAVDHTSRELDMEDQEGEKKGQ